LKGRSSEKEKYLKACNRASAALAKVVEMEGEFTAFDTRILTQSGAAEILSTQKTESAVTSIASQSAQTRLNAGTSM